jgi:beta-lactam-binding protein with PASTA domain/tRNA A-37 threonylcarbamoyl transferase component Bud32
METTVQPAAGADGLVGQTLDGRYRVLSRIARGGMATVYEATDSRLDRTVAIKVMHPGLAEDSAFVERFRREARAAARLSHPNVVAVHDQGETSGLPYLVMEYVSGQTLRDVLRDHGPLTPEQALTIIEPVLDALAAAHDAGFIHRDIKPENILISHDGRIKVADFGLARAVTTMSATQGVLIGTVAYLSPEHVERGEADARSDVYGAGICLFEMLTGSVPYSAENPLTVAYQHVHGDVPAPSSVVAHIPPAVDTVVMDATRRNPDDRYPDCRAFASEVRQLRSSLPPPLPFSFPQPSPATDQETLVVSDSADAVGSAGGTVPVPRRKARRRWPWIIGLLLLLGAIAGAAFGGWYLSIGPGRTVAVPGLIGLDVPAATALAAESDLQAAISAEAFSETVAAGLVIDTDPTPGSEVSPGTQIDLIVSLGPERFDVPELAGLNLEQAEAAIAEAQLALGDVRRSYDDVVSRGLVISSDPAPGTALKADTPVSLVVSRGPRPVDIPDLVGENAADASSRLTNAGLNVVTTEEFSTVYSAGRVISSTPAAGAKVDVGGTITLVVSKGPPPVEVPYLIDLFREDAVALLESRGLVAVIQEGPFTPLNRVIRQSPSAGTFIPQGSSVTITII